MNLMLESSKASVMRQWINAAYELHLYTNIHYGGMKSLGKGSIQRKWSKQNMNTQISTEDEIVGVNDHMSGALWIMKFLEDQGYVIEDNIIFQENQSEIITKKNEKYSCG